MRERLIGHHLMTTMRKIGIIRITSGIIVARRLLLLLRLIEIPIRIRIDIDSTSRSGGRRWSSINKPIIRGTLIRKILMIINRMMSIELI